MRVGSQAVSTPHEDPTNYPFDWRWQLACALQADRTVVHPLWVCEDGLLGECMLYMKLERAGLKGWSDPRHIRQVIQLHGSALCDIIEAYLISDCSMQEIAGDLRLEEVEINSYAGLFFDVRQGSGGPRCLQTAERLERESVDQPMSRGLLLKRAGLAGKSALRAVLGVAGSRQDSTVQSRLEQEVWRRVFTGQISTADLIRAALLELERSKQPGRKDPQESRAQQFMRSIIQEMAPVMLTPDKDPARVAEQDALWKAKLATQQKVRDTKLDDRGEAAARTKLQEMVGGKLRNREQ